MPNRLVRNTALLAKVETTYGVDSTPTGAANAMLMSEININPLNAQLVDRDIIRPFLGGSEQLTGTRYQEMTFSVELVGAGTAGVAPAWGPLLRGCGFAETLIATTRVDYTLLSTGMESLTLKWYDDGLLHSSPGCRGTVQLGMSAGGRPIANYRFVGLYTTPTVAANPAVTLTAFKTPQTVVDANSGDLTFGATLSPTGAPALTGGTPYPSQGLTLDLGNEVPFTALLGGETVDITARALSGRVVLDLTAAQEAAFFGQVELATLQSIGLQHGTVVGNRVMVFAPGAQLFNPRKENVNGKRLVGFDLRGVPVAGNDELRIVTSF